MKSLALLAVPAALLLGACATPAPSTPAAEPKQVAQAGEKSLEGQITTGSRLKRGTERSVRVIGNEEYKDSNDVRSIGNLVGARSN